MTTSPRAPTDRAPTARARGPSPVSRCRSTWNGSPDETRHDHRHRRPAAADPGGFGHPAAVGPLRACADRHVSRAYGGVAGWDPRCWAGVRPPWLPRVGCMSGPIRYGSERTTSRTVWRRGFGGAARLTSTLWSYTTPGSA